MPSTSPSARAPSASCFFFSSRRRHTRLQGDWSSDVCSSDLIPTLARQLLAELSGREAELGRRVTADSRTLQAVPPRAIDEARLQRQVTLAENLFTSLQKNYDEARLAEESAVPDARILDHAVVPQDPVRNTAPRVVFLGFAASLALGL